MVTSLFPAVYEVRTAIKGHNADTQIRELEQNLDAKVVTIADLSEIQRVRYFLLLTA